MLSCYAFLETKIQPLHYGLFNVEKVFGVLVPHMLEMSVFYTVAEILSKTLEKKSIKQMGELIYDDHDLTY